MSVRLFASLTVTAICLGDLASAVAVEGRVELELSMSSTFPAASQQQWYKLLTELGVDGLRIRKAAADDKVEVKIAGSKAAPVYRVVGLLKSASELDLPGGKFSPRDRGRLSAWLAKLRAEGPSSAAGGGSFAPFGLTAKQFAAVNADLGWRVAFSTKGLTPGELLEKLAPALSNVLAVDQPTNLRLAHAQPMAEELEGLTSGTAIAYALRSEGLAMLPRLNDRKTPEYAVIRPDGKQTTWPVGWPLEDRKPKDVLPELFESHNAQIDDFPLAEALEAIGERLKTPVLYDHYALSRQGIDVAKVTVKFPASKTWYAKVIDKRLHQAGLTGEWRLDDGGRPLLWVPTLKPVKTG